MKLEAITGKVLHRVTNADLILGEYSAYPVVVFDDYMKGIKSKKYEFYRTEYEEEVVSNKNRNERIAYHSQKAYNQKRGVLILVTQIEHAKNIQDCISERISGVRCEFIQGETSAEERNLILKDFSEGLVPFLISTSVLREGVDIPNIECLIIAFGGLSSVATLQSVGRSLRKLRGSSRPVVIVDFMDRGGAYLLKHSKKRLATYESEGFAVVDSWMKL
jgi:superfamily II DNA or RNA helicase